MYSLKWRNLYIHLKQRLAVLFVGEDCMQKKLDKTVGDNKIRGSYRTPFGQDIDFYKDRYKILKFILKPLIHSEI